MQTALKPKHPGGRPTKYTPELLEQARVYVRDHPDDLVPSVVGLTETLDISEETAYKWIKERNKREFSEIVKRIRSAQHRALLNGGLGGTLNPGIAKLMLAKHGYSDNPQQDQGVTITVDRTCGRTTISKGKDKVTINDGKAIEQA